MLRVLSLVLLLLSGCASRTVIRSNPSGARVSVDGAFVGVTPYTHQDSKIAFSTTAIRLSKPGYQDFVTTLRRDEQLNPAACVFGSCCLVPYLWVFGYKSERLYVMDPVTGAGDEASPAGPYPPGEVPPSDWVQPGDPPL